MESPVPFLAANALMWTLMTVVLVAVPALTERGSNRHAPFAAASDWRPSWPAESARGVNTGAHRTED